MNTLSNIFNFLFPRQCIGCGYYGDYICPTCKKRYIKHQKHYCHVCKKFTKIGELAHKNCIKNSNLDFVFVCLKYNKFIEKLIADIKYNLYTDVVNSIVPFYIEKFLQNFSDYRNIILVPVPLYYRRRWSRGFNQSELIALKLQENLNVECLNLLKRNRNTKHQVGLKRADRITNVFNAFGFKDKIWRDFFQRTKRKKEEIMIFLIDDVMTTGSTLEEAAKVLREHGFKNIAGIVLARGD